MITTDFLEIFRIWEIFCKCDVLMFKIVSQLLNIYCCKPKMPNKRPLLSRMESMMLASNDSVN